MYGDDIVKNYTNAGSISLALCVLILTLTILQTTKNSHLKTYNRLTLKPYYSVMAVLFFFILYTVFVEIWNPVPPLEMIKREIEATKAFFTYYTVSV